MTDTAARPPLDTRFPRWRRRFLGIAGAAVIAWWFLTRVLVVGGARPGGIGPAVGDHWHAPYRIEVCGRTLERFPDMPRGGLHTHGDGEIHAHPLQADQAGINATLALFVASCGGKLTETELVLPSGEHHVNGEPCPDGKPGRWILRVDGRPVTPIASYVIEDHATVRLSFEAD